MNVQLPIDATTELHTSSPTDRVIYEMQVYGYRPFQEEPDPRPLPEEPVVQSALTAMFDAMFEMLGDTRLEADLEDVLWSAVNLFHRAGERIQRELQRNEDAQRNGQREQDGSEVKSVELERHIMEGISLLERRNAFEFMRDFASDLFEAQTGSTWRPRTGSKVNHANMTAAMIDSRDFLSARRRAETEVLIPAGTKIAFGGGLDYNDHERIWAALDKALAKHADMVLLHGGSPKGAERIAACWAESRGVTQVAFKPNWSKHAKAAPFRRNDEMLSVMPAGVIVFPGSGITENLRDKARRFGITVWELKGGGSFPPGVQPDVEAPLGFRARMPHQALVFAIGQSFDGAQLRGNVHPLVQNGRDDKGRVVVHSDIGGIMMLDLVEAEQGVAHPLFLLRADAGVGFGDLLEALPKQASIGFRLLRRPDPRRLADRQTVVFQRRRQDKDAGSH